MSPRLPLRPLQLFPESLANLRGQGTISKAKYTAQKDDPAQREVRINTAFDAVNDPHDHRSFRTLGKDYNISKSTLEHRKDGAKPKNKAHEKDQYLSEEEERGMEKVLRSIEQLHWNLAPSITTTIAHRTRLLREPDAVPPGSHSANRFQRRWQRTVSLGIGTLEDKHRHTAKHPRTVIAFLENVSSFVLIVREDVWRALTELVGVGPLALYSSFLNQLGLQKLEKSIETDSLVLLSPHAIVISLRTLHRWKPRARHSRRVRLRPPPIVFQKLPASQYLC